MRRVVPKLVLGVFYSLCCAHLLSAQSVFINEVMTANSHSLRDENGDSPDWIELFNPGAVPVSLAGYGLSDDAALPFKWTFREAAIEPGGFLVVFASGKDRQPGSVAPTNPPAVAGLKVWLSADDVATNDATQTRSSAGEFFVRQWINRSGAANPARQTTDDLQPQFLPAVAELNNRPALRFDGIKDLLALSVVPAQDNFCVIVAARALAGHEVDPEGASGVGGVSGQRYLFGATHGGDVNAGAGLSVGTNGVSVYEHGANYMPALAVYKGPFGAGAAIISVNYSNKQPFLYLQGNLARAGVLSPRMTVTAPTQIGSGAYGAFAGDVAEILIYDRALSESERRSVEENLAARYAVRLPAPLHTNFKLDADGDPVLLTRPDGSRADAFPPVALPVDASFGRQPDGGLAGFFFAQPTPGASNRTPGTTEFVQAPQFSEPAGFHTASFYLALNVTNTGAIIRYTLDGSEPGEGSTIYSAPILITNRTAAPNNLSLIPTVPSGYLPPTSQVFKGTVVRARAFKPGALSSAAVTRTFFVDSKGRARYTVPIVSIATAPANFFAPDTGIYVPGNAPGGNYSQRGDDWQRPVHVELFETDGAVAFAQDADVKIHGNTSQNFPIKGLDFDGNGGQGRHAFRYRIFPERLRAEFEHFLLRPSGQDYYLAFMRDEFMQGVAAELGMETQASRLAVVFLNGEYWGLHYLREKEDTDFIAYYGHCAPDAVDFLEGYVGARDGDTGHYDAMIQFLQTQDVRVPANYAQVQTLMEVPNYLDYKTTEIFNYRWDIGNHRLWRPRTTEGRWRWIQFDDDVGFGGFAAVPPPWAFNMLAYDLEPNGPWTQYALNDHNNPTATYLLRTLMLNDSFRRDFINRFADLLNTTFQPPHLIERINQMAATLAPEMPEHIQRWRAPGSFAEWSNNVQVLRAFAANRPAYARQQIAAYFGLRGTANLALAVSDTNRGGININSLAIAAPTNAPWSGVYFKDNLITLTAVAKPGFRFTGWQGILGVATNAVTLLLNGDLALSASFEVDPDAAPIPAPFDLSKADYAFNAWGAVEPAGTYPSNMVFVQSAVADPGLGAEPDALWTLPYDRTNRSRVNGLGDAGFAFVNTSNPQADGGGYLGAAVLGLKTSNAQNIFVSWQGGTVTTNERVYAVRLQYRVGATNTWRDVLDSLGRPVEYVRNPIAGHSQAFGPVELPPDVNGRPYVQLRWKYYHVSGATGPRAQLRVDDILVAAAGAAPVFTGIESLSDGGVRFQMRGQPNRQYIIESSTNLFAWETVRAMDADATGLIEFVESNSSPSRARFFRARTP